MAGKLILVGGYCATGKSTFSLKLADYLNIPCFNKDIIKEIMGDYIGAENEKALSRLSATTFGLMTHMAEKLLETGNSLILESNFRKSEINQLSLLIEKYRWDCLTYLFTADLDVAYDRYMERQDAGERHWVHISAGEDRERFKKGHLLHIQSEALNDGRTVITDTTVFKNVDYDHLLEIAGKFFFI